MTIALPIILASVLAMASCQNKPVRHVAESPSLEVSDRGAVAIKGDSQVQPKVDTKKSEATITLPEGSTFDFNEKLGTVRLTLSKASQMAVNRTETAIEGPRSFVPDKAPTVGEEKKAQSDFWVNLGMKAGLAIGVALAIFGLVRGWDMIMYGGGAVAGACAFGIFVEKHPILLTIIGLGVAVSVVGPYLWHTKLKKLTNDLPK